MLDIQRVLKQDRLLRALTGLNRKAFDALLTPFSSRYEQTRQTQPRQRAVGGGRKARLVSTQEKLFFILFYFKCYPTFDLAGIIFDLHCSQAHEWMHRLQSLLEETLGEQMALPERRLDSIEASKAREGKLHDKRLHDEEDMAASVPDAIPIAVDLGFLGLQKE
jgi:hypothetical protein